MANFEGNIHLSSRMRLSVFYEKFGTEIFYMKMPSLDNEDFWNGSLGFNRYHHCNLWLANMEERGYVLRKKRGYYSLTPLGLTICLSGISKLREMTVELQKTLSSLRGQLEIVIQKIEPNQKCAGLKNELDKAEALVHGIKELQQKNAS